MVRQDAARWLALCARRLCGVSQLTSGNMRCDLGDGLAGAVVWPAGAAAEYPGPGLFPGAGASCCRRCRWPGIQVPSRRAW